MEQERILETLRAAVAYQLLSVGVESDEVNLWHPSMAMCLKRLIDEPDYKANVLDVWAEIFENHNGEMYEALREMLEGTKLWDDLITKTNLSVSGMGGIPHTNKN